jgi:integration host factor subunit alpha
LPNRLNWKSFYRWLRNSSYDTTISEFGKSCVKEKKARKGRNPATGEDMMFEARKVVTFKCSGN